MFKLRVAASAALLSVAATPAAAVMFKTTYAFEAVTPGPTAVHTGTFTIAYDDLLGTADLFAMDFTLGAVHFTAANAAAQFFPDPEVLIYGALNFTTVAAGTDDFFFRFNRDVPEGLDFVYAQAGDPGIYGIFPMRVVAIPEPESWALMLLGFGAVGSGLRRRRIASIRVGQDFGGARGAIL